MPAKQKQKTLTRDDVRVEPIDMRVFQGSTMIGRVTSNNTGKWWWCLTAFVDPMQPAFVTGSSRTREAAIRAVIRAENARRKGD